MGRIVKQECYVVLLYIRATGRNVWEFPLSRWGGMEQGSCKIIVFPLNNFTRVMLMPIKPCYFY